MQGLNVLYQSDNNYAAFMGVSICSLLENNKDANIINVYIIDDSISPENKTKLVDMVQSYSRNITFLTGDIIFQKQDIVEAFSYTGMRKNTHSYLKMFIDELLPDLNGRVIYIDCDTAVVGSLSGLLSIDMNGNTIGMVMDSLVTKSREVIGIPENECYYNSGVILIDLQQWRHNQCSKRILNHIKNIRTYGTVDQDVLNVELKNEIYTLPIEYNLQPVHLEHPYERYTKVYKHKEQYYSKEEIEQAVRNPKIIHYLRYIGESPWHEGNVHPGTKYFDEYLQMSPWRDYCKQAANRGLLFKLEKWMYRYLPKGIFLRIFYIVHERMIRKSNSIKC